MCPFPPIRKLQYVIAVAHKLHFRKAAEALNVSQPALSRQIKELEDYVGFSILRRDNHFVTLTKAGAAFVDRIHEIVTRAEKDFEDAVFSARAISEAKPDEYLIAHSPFAPMQIRTLAMELRKQMETGPPVRFRILPTMQILNAIEQDTVHGGITYAPVDQDTLESHRIGIDYWVAVVPKQSNFPQEKSARIEMLKGAKLISNGADRTHPALFRQLERECAAKGVSMRMMVEVTSPNEAFDLVADNQGIVLLPEGVCGAHPTSVRAIRIEDISPLEVVVVYRKDAPDFMRHFAVELSAANRSDYGHLRKSPSSITSKMIGEVVAGGKNRMRRTQDLKQKSA
jgi:DNA-binding transcriptional LysR family regulator